MMRQLTALSAFFAFLAFPAFAQVALFTENFDACTLPAGWEVKSTGNQNPVWYVGDAVQNNDNNGQSIDGTCFLFIDDDATGDQTPAYVIDFISPPFDASQHPTVELSVDVHYRDWDQAAENFDVLVTDGTTETLIRRYDNFHATGNNLYDFETLVFDLSLVTKSPNTQLIFRYNDAGSFNWWAGVDNISVVGKGQGTNVVVESFNGCEKPAGWETQIVTGADDWKFGLITEGAALGGGNSMDGTCFAFFDDDILGQDTPFSVVRLASPWFDGTQFGQFYLDFDIILRYYKEKISVYVQNGNGEEFIVRASDGDVGGPYFPNYVHAALDLSPYRSQQMRVIFEFDDGQDWGWWAGIDNVKVTGLGAANDVCTHAKQLITGQICEPSSNNNALLDGPLPTCVEKSVGGLWYTWTADFTGIAKLTTNASFNDVVNVFTGDCATPQLLLCNNRDEHGFTGESTYFPVVSGLTYLLRVSGQEGSFGISRGTLCVGIDQVAAAPPIPANDDCANALSLVVDATCLNANNLNATSSPTLPTFNELARHDVWYAFTAPALVPNEVLEVQSNANFSDIITAYSGSCDSLKEVASSHKGRFLQLSNLTVDEIYLIQVSGTFATVEGSLCPQILKKNLDAPANDQCASAISVNIGGACTAGSNVGAVFGGPSPTANVLPPCVASIASDVWYQFVAPTSGSVRVNTGADFPHILAVWKGQCGNFENVLCAENPLRCDGFLTLGALSAGETYYVQIASLIAANSPQAGNFCLQILDGSQQPPFVVISLQVEEKCVSTNISELKIEAHGGVPPYTFNGTPNGQMLASGETYLVVITDAIGCEKALSGTADDCELVVCAVTGTLTTLQPNCYNVTNGSLAATVTGGTGPYNYLWSNAATTAQISNLAAGDYSATVTDAFGCNLTLTATIINPSAITAVPTSTEQPHQGQSDGAIFLDIAGGNGQYGYIWLRNGTPFVNSEDLTTAPAGDYTLIVTDGNGCTASFDFTLTETVGNQEISTEYFTEVFPNPAQEKAWLAVAFPKAQTLYLTLLDPAGRVLSTWTVRDVTEQNILVDLKGLPAGSYQLRIRTEKEMIIEKVVVGK
ncbi:MAG: T9SS type A sorting domain-containing protein [Phycisphaerae bacterium]|nr:T9SS type A sorting domain-containing protein [Saprospiraceae bacterium]